MVTAPVYSVLYCRPDTERTANPHKALVNKATVFPGARGRCRPKALINLRRVQQPATQQGRVKPTKVCLLSDSLTGGSRGQSGEDGLSEDSLEELMPDGEHGRMERWQGHRARLPEERHMIKVQSPTTQHRGRQGWRKRARQT